MRQIAAILTFFSLLFTTRAQTVEARRLVMERLQQEADRFAELAPQIQGREILQQTRPPKTQRQIISDYGFLALRPGDIREVRQVQAVDGKMVKKHGDGLKDLAQSVMAADDKQRRKLLESFEKHGLSGVAVDFGPLILLFAGPSIQKFEFIFQRMDNANGSPAAVYRYEQIDGAGGLTIFSDGKPIRQKLRGELWAQPSDGVPMRIVLDSEHMEGKSKIRDFTFVDYSRSEFGPLLPVLVGHRQFNDRTPIVQDLFRYSNYHK
jgi:hypothetical protein